MSLKERIGKILSRPSHKDGPSEKAKSGFSVAFYDLRKKSDAKERGVTPGFYFTVHPILENDLEHPNLINEFTLSFFEKLRSEGLLKESDTRIPVDTKSELFVDPAQGWLFSPAGYIPSLRLLVVRADQVDRDENQEMLVKALR